MIEPILMLEFLEQLLFQMPAHRFFDGSPLRGNSLFVRLPLLRSARIDLTWQMRDLRPMRTDFPLARLGVGIHERGNVAAPEPPSRKTSLTDAEMSCSNPAFV
jgi:hypothetical protein